MEWIEEELVFDPTARMTRHKFINTENPDFIICRHDGQWSMCILCGNGIAVAIEANE